MTESPSVTGALHNRVLHSRARLFDRVSGIEILLWLVVLVAVLNFAPALFERIDLGDEPTSRKVLKDIPVVLLLAAGALVAWHHRDIWRQQHRARRVAVLAVALGAVMTVDAAVRTPDAFGFLVSSRYYVAYPLVAIAVWLLSPSRASVERLLRGVCMLGAIEGVLAVASVYELFGDTFYDNYVTFGGRDLARGIGTLGSPDNLALFLGLPALLLIWGRLFAGALRWTLLALVLLGVLVTFSKSGILALAVSNIVLVLQRRGRASLPHAGALILASLGALYVALAARSRTDLSPRALLGNRTESIVDGLELWVGDVSTFLVGDGFGTLNVVESGEIRRTFTTDSMFVTIALEGGLVALVLFGALVWAGVAIAYRAIDHAPYTRALFGYVVFVIAFTPVAVSLKLFPGALLFWIAIGLCATAAMPARGSPTAQADALRPTR